MVTHTLSYQTLSLEGGQKYPIQTKLVRLMTGVLIESVLVKF